MARTSDIIEGLQILQKYDEPTGHLGGAEHDIIWGPQTQGDVSDEDKARLESLGWRYDESVEGWSHFA
jgi:hypothetical protein